MLLGTLVGALKNPVAYLVRTPLEKEPQPHQFSPGCGFNTFVLISLFQRSACRTVKIINLNNAIR